uniref:Uncharacterized protein n=1 Tax=Anopheles funestus TaxID=62324 RepID=A0A182S241_ANOFN
MGIFRKISFVVALFNVLLLFVCFFVFYRYKSINLYYNRLRVCVAIKVWSCTERHSSICLLSIYLCSLLVFAFPFFPPLLLTIIISHSFAFSIIFHSLAFCTQDDHVCVVVEFCLTIKVQ